MGKYARRLRLLVETSRPQFYFVPVYFYVSAFVILGSEITLPVAVQAVSLSFPLTLFINGVNDIYDTEADALDDLRKEGETVDDRFDDVSTLRLYLAVAAGVVLAASLPFGVQNTVFAGAMLFVGYVYSAPPLRLKERPPLDSLSNGVIAVALAFLLGVTTFADPAEVALWTYAKVVVLTLGIAAAHAYYAAVDYAPDKEAGLDTVATRYGRRTCVVSALVVVVLSYFVFAPELGVYFEVIVVYIVALLVYALRDPEPERMHRAAKLIYPGFIVAVLLFIAFDAEPVRVSLEALGIEFAVGGYGQ
ncbi:UbiA family prenyltransferase [Haladaptatus sp. F3-133]|jgi:4-hydroxybenzoate polyprenyltransferase|uniref:UbiA family prenyltransferase n=1 Tax=Halorutilus salinus TaxID=2487751 RepID=A0A9Q4C477_9EURY|nr:UbiA family prenyltransferase [Halorutilus salinus]MCX2818777.1 UbiA family prenyltransferase [Halorutilus salinus]